MCLSTSVDRRSPTWKEAMNSLSHLNEHGEHCALSETLEKLARNHGDEFFTLAQVECNLAKVINLDRGLQSLWSESLLAMARNADDFYSRRSEERRRVEGTGAVTRTIE